MSYFEGVHRNLFDRSSTQSLRSSLFESVEENGRTYHKYKQGSNYYVAIEKDFALANSVKLTTYPMTR